MSFLKLNSTLASNLLIWTELLSLYIEGLGFTSIEFCLYNRGSSSLSLSSGHFLPEVFKFSAELSEPSIFPFSMKNLDFPTGSGFSSSSSFGLFGMPSSSNPELLLILLLEVGYVL